MPTSAPILEVRNVTVEFPSVIALKDVSIAFLRSQVHGIVGENGAGKSTLMRVLAGIQMPTSGEVKIEGKPITLRSVRDAEESGIVMVHQELNLIDELTVAENLFLGREPRRGFILNRKSIEQDANLLLRKVRAPFSARDKVGDLPLASKQLVEIAKALSRRANVLILDEPTAVLSKPEVEILFEIVRSLKDSGVAVVYISHHLAEIQAICDEVTVLRDGQVVDSLDAVDATPEALAYRMVGRELGEFFPSKAQLPVSDPILKVMSLRSEPWVKDVSFSVSPGEILGLAGLIGSGRTESAESIMGLRRRDGGEIFLEGASLGRGDVGESVRCGIAYLSEDRKGTGLHLSLDLASNVTMVTLRRYAHPFRSISEEKATAKSWIDKLDIRVNNPEDPIRQLSGGNQQKVGLAKWLDTNPKVLILDEPTRGVDVGAKREIYDLIQTLATQGMACIIISSEMTELIGLCHRILVMRSGKVQGELAGEEMTEQNIVRLAASVGNEVAEVA